MNLDLFRRSRKEPWLMPAFGKTKRALLLVPFAVAALQASTETDTNFIDALYGDLLNRPAGPSDVSAGLAFLAGNTHQQFAALELGSTEYQTKLVDSYFQSYLLRGPNPGELALSLALLGSGSDQTVQETILGSPGFFSHSGGDNAGFVDGLFFTLLNRIPSLAEQDAFVLELTGGATRAAVAAEFLGLTEYNQELLTGYYQQYLDRPPASGESAVFVPQLVAGGNNENVQAAILGSVEYNAVAQAEALPEPANWSLIGIGLALLAGLRLAGDATPWRHRGDLQ